MGRSVIDYAAVSESISHQTSDLNVLTNGAIDSPHNPLWIELNLNNKSQPAPVKPPKWNIKRLSEETYLKAYTDTISEKSTSVESALKRSLRKIFQSDTNPISERKASNIINSAWNTIKRTINNAASATIGKITNLYNNRDDFCDAEIQHLHNLSESEKYPIKKLKSLS
jgi:hypothetical protein